MKDNFEEVFAMLNRAIAGENIAFEEVQAMKWPFHDKLDPLIQRIYRELQMFASDEDIRKRDPSLGNYWKTGLMKLRDELTACVREENRR